MFILTTISDKLPLDPQLLNIPKGEAITKVIEKQYFDKVIHNVGLVVTIYDILEIAGGHIYPSDPSPYFQIKFRLVIFRPFLGEVIVGRISSCSK